MSYNGITTNISPENALSVYSPIYYMQPIQYNTFFFGDWGRSNALALVQNYADGSFNSYTSLNDEIRIVWTLPQFPDFWYYFIPQRFEFSTISATARSLNSYSQSLTTSFSTAFPIRLSLMTKDSTNRYQDIETRIGYQNTVYFNERRIVDSLGIGMSEMITFTNQDNIQFSYNLAMSSENYITNLRPYESLYGFVDRISTVSPEDDT